MWYLTRLGRLYHAYGQIKAKGFVDGSWKRGTIRRLRLLNAAIRQEQRRRYGHSIYTRQT